jgi:peptidoglycan hydrolase CwlO-like protein
VIGGNHRIGGGMGDPVIIPIFRKPRRIHLKKVSSEENPFKIFQDIDQIFESFLEGFAKGLDDENEHNKKTRSSQKDLKREIDKLEKKINQEDNIIVTNIRDITNKSQEYFYILL